MGTSLLCLLLSLVQGRNNIYCFFDNIKFVGDRISEALSRMTLEGKIEISHTQFKFTSTGVLGLAIWGIAMSDGPHGIREDVFCDL